MEKTYKLRICDEVVEIIPFIDTVPLLLLDCGKIIFRGEQIGYFSDTDYEIDFKRASFFGFMPVEKYSKLIKLGTLDYYEDTGIFEVSDGEDIIQRFKLNLAIEEITA